MEKLENFCQNVAKSKYNKNQNIFLKNLTIQETLPFQIYFKNVFVRLMQKDSLKKNIFLKKINENIDILDIINKNIDKDYEEKKKKEKQIKDKKNKKSKNNLKKNNNNKTIGNLSNDNKNILDNNKNI